MIDEIKFHREELQALCRRLHVQRLDLFGSAARGDFDPERSDMYVPHWGRSGCGSRRCGGRWCRFGLGGLPAAIWR
jgi:hypothetical protein